MQRGILLKSITLVYGPQSPSSLHCPPTITAVLALPLLVVPPLAEAATQVQLTRSGTCCDKMHWKYSAAVSHPDDALEPLLVVPHPKGQGQDEEVCPAEDEDRGGVLLEPQPNSQWQEEEVCSAAEEERGVLLEPHPNNQWQEEEVCSVEEED